VVHCLKAKYRKSPVQKAIAAIERKSELKLYVTQVMHMIVASWNAVNSATIVNGFRKSGLTSTHIPPGEDEYDVDDGDYDVKEEDWRKLSSEIDFSDFVICDDDVFTTLRLSIEDVCDAAEKDVENKAAEKDEEVEEVTPVPAFGEAVAGFDDICASSK
jgi:transcription antitermination factor NusG